MVRLAGAGVSGLLVVISILSCMAIPPPPPPSPFGGGGGGGNSKPNGLRGSQIYLQDPWMHEHNYYPKSHNLGPHNHHGWGASGGSGGGGGGHGSNSIQLPESATYVQKLYPVFGFSSNMKRLSSAIQSLKPGKHWKWSAPAVALFGSDGTPHHVQLGGNDQSHAGQNENDGWSYNHGSHHIGHTVPTKTQYSTW